MGAERHVKLFRNGRNQAVRIPREFEIAGDEAVMRKEGEKLVIEPADDRTTRIHTLLEKFRREGALEEGDDPFDFDDPPPEPVEF